MTTQGNSRRRRLEQENASLRARVEEAERGIAGEQADPASLAEAQVGATAAAERYEALRTELRALRLDAALEGLWRLFGVTEPGTARALMDEAAIEWGEDDRPDPASVQAALRAALQAHPRLFWPGSADGAATGRGVARPPSMTSLIRADAARQRERREAEGPAIEVVG
jgi:hypothetical protein